MAGTPARGLACREGFADPDPLLGFAGQQEMAVTFEEDPEPGGDTAAFEVDGEQPGKESHAMKKARIDRKYTTQLELEAHRHGNW